MKDSIADTSQVGTELKLSCQVKEREEEEAMDGDPTMTDLFFLLLLKNPSPHGHSVFNEAVGSILCASYRLIHEQLRLGSELKHQPSHS